MHSADLVLPVKGHPMTDMTTPTTPRSVLLAAADLANTPRRPVLADGEQ